MIDLDEEGMVLCPHCDKRYKPVLKRLDDRNLQEQYPNAERWEREQLISGICSQKCWDEYLGIGTQEDFFEEEKV